MRRALEMSSYALLTSSRNADGCGPEFLQIMPRSHSIKYPSSVSYVSLRCRVGVHLPLAAGHSDVDEATGVCDALLRPAFGRLLLLLRLDLWNCVCLLEWLLDIPRLPK